MKVVIAPDSFKGSLSAPEAAACIAAGWKRVFPEAETVLLPIADGGEGTLDALITATQGKIFPGNVTGPLGEPLPARWGLLSDGETAVIELAEAAGLTQVPASQRDPKITTTFGVGELLRAAISTPSVRKVIIGLGGSATNDGGAGLLTALGVRLRDAAGNALAPGGAALSQLARVDTSNLAIDPAAVSVLIACDVDNPLTGPRGASAIFGPQKGATPEDIGLLDAALAHFAEVLGVSGDTPGAGAAGGTAFGLLTLFPHAELRPGIDLVLDAVAFERHLDGADLLLTGEGRLDGQTLGGKAVAGIAGRARNVGVPVAAIVGAVGGDVAMETLAKQTGVNAVLPLVPGPVTLEEAMTNAAVYLTEATERAAQWFRLGQTLRQGRESR